MKSNELLMIYGTEYKEMAKQLLEAADLAGRIPDAGSRIGLKPNLVSPSEASWGATTHPEIVAGTIEYLKEHGFENLVILEGSWVGDKTAEAFEVCGYDRLVREYGVEFIDTQKDSFHTKDCAGMELEICDSVEHLDFLINLPVLKGHCQTRITCASRSSRFWRTWNLRQRTGFGSGWFWEREFWLVWSCRSLSAGRRKPAVP